MPDPDPDTRTAQLVERAHRRDPAAITALYERYRDRLRQALRRKLGPAYRRTLLDTEDAVQDGILAALSSLHQFEYTSSGSFLAWVLRVAERQLLMRVRADRADQRARDRTVALDPDADAGALPSPSEVARGRELEERIAACLEELPEAMREVLVLRRYLELTHDEIRAELKLPSAGAARALLSRAQARLAVLLGEGQQS